MRGWDPVGEATILNFFWHNSSKTKSALGVNMQLRNCPQWLPAPFVIALVLELCQASRSLLSQPFVM